MKKTLKRPAVKTVALERPLRDIALELATRCNLACKMCSAWKRREDGLSHEKILSLLDEARDLGATSFHPWGTELFAREDTIEILNCAERIGFEEICVVSNGVLLTKGHRLEALEKLGKLKINISLDGPREVHDDLRGKGVYDAAVEALREMRRRGIKCGLASVIMRQTIDRLKDIVDLAAHLGIPGISLQPYNRETAGPDKDHSEFEFRPGEEDPLRGKLEELLRYAGSRNVRIYTENLMDLVPPYLTRGIRPRPPHGCSLPSKSLVVDNRGQTHPCFFMWGTGMGSVHEKSLGAIWHGDIRRKLTMLAMDGKCPGCLANCSDVENFNSRSRLVGLTARPVRIMSRLVRELIRPALH